jgi:hypothetical protein
MKLKMKGTSQEQRWGFAPGWNARNGNVILYWTDELSMQVCLREQTKLKVFKVDVVRIFPCRLLVDTYITVLVVKVPMSSRKPVTFLEHL